MNHIRRAQAMLDSVPGLKFCRSSICYETTPWQMDSTRNFINGVWEFETKIVPHKLLELLQAIEFSLGRNHRKEKEQKQKNGAQYVDRIIDLDILLYGNQVIKEINLEIPHPRLAERNFVLIPLKELLFENIYSEFKQNINQMIRLNEQKGQKVRPYEASQT